MACNMTPDGGIYLNSYKYDRRPKSTKDIPIKIWFQPLQKNQELNQQTPKNLLYN